MWLGHEAFQKHRRTCVTWLGFRYADREEGNVRKMFNVKKAAKPLVGVWTSLDKGQA